VDYIIQPKNNEDLTILYMVVAGSILTPLAVAAPLATSDRTPLCISRIKFFSSGVIPRSTLFRLTFVLLFQRLSIAEMGKVPSARLSLHSTKLCTKFKIIRKILFFDYKVTSAAFLSISQNLKVTRLQGGTQQNLNWLMKLRSFKVI
jgi:hypothetical protein